MSVIVPVYNGETFLEGTVSSILSSTLRDIEVVLVDDNSQDGTSSLCSRIASSDGRVKVVTNELNRGVAGSRNEGILRSKGEYVAFVDHDDRVASDMYSAMYQAALRCEGGADLVDCSYETVWPDRRTMSRNLHPKGVCLNRDYLLSEVVAPLVGVRRADGLFIGNVVWNKIFRRRLIVDNALSFEPTRRKYEDKLFVVEFLSKARCAVFVEEPFYRWMRRPDSLITTHYRGEAKAVVENLERYESLYGKLLDFGSDDARAYRAAAVYDALRTAYVRAPTRRVRYERVVELLDDKRILKWLTEDSSRSVGRRVLSAAARQRVGRRALISLALGPSLLRSRAARKWRVASNRARKAALK